MVERDHGGNVSEIARMYRIGEESIIDFSANINPFGYPPGLKEAVMSDFESILNYPDIDSYELAAALSSYHGIPRQSIVVGNGSTEFMYLLPTVFKPETALIVSPAFSEYEKGLRIAGADISYFAADRDKGFSLDVDGLCARIHEGYDMVYLCNPANPTGILTEKDDLLRIIETAGLTGAICIIDEAFIDFVEEASVKEETGRFDSLIVMRSMTKFFGIPGLRVGYLIAEPSLIETIAKSKTPWTVNSLVQRAAVTALEASDYIEASRQVVRSEREYLKEALGALPGLTVYDGAANFLFVCIDERCAVGSTALRDSLRRDGLLIRDCSNFHGLNDRYFRVAVKQREQNEILVKRLREIVKW
ncbi:MAG: threonine-phosphate decarboxylase [Deltaproteobacteria bacterium]|nr:threonine-phosphate decarboxylase [Deltaproteobacteria bacterium]